MELKLVGAVASAVKREQAIGNFLINMYKEKLSYFEKKYEIGTQVFLKKFEGGELGDSEDFFEWFALAKAESHWVTKIKELKETSS